MTGQTSDSAAGSLVAELIQSRNASASEALAIFRAQVAAFQRRLATIRGYRVRRIALCLAFPMTVVALIVGTELRWIPHFSPLLVGAGAALIAALVCGIWKRYYYWICAVIYQDSHKANRRFHIEEARIVATNSGVVTSIPWSAISNIVVDKDNLTVCYLSLDAIFLPKAAFDSQDVEGFCAELQRRWKQAQHSDVAAAHV